MHQMPVLRQAENVVRHFKKTVRLIICILTASLATLFFGFKVLTNPVYIKGHLKKNPKDTSAYVGRLAVFVKGDNRILTSTLADDKGDFELTFTPHKENSFDFFCAGISVDTMLFASIKSFESDTPDLTFFIPTLKKKNLLGQTLCPKCNRADKVYKIVYGDGLPVSMIISGSGDTTYSNIVNGHYNAGTCIVGIPKFYCDRDKIKF